MLQQLGKPISSQLISSFLSAFQLFPKIRFLSYQRLATSLKNIIFVFRCFNNLKFSPFNIRKQQNIKPKSQLKRSPFLQHIPTFMLIKFSDNPMHMLIFSFFLHFHFKKRHYDSLNSIALLC